MSNLEQYYNQEILPQTQGFDKSVCVPFDKHTEEQKKAFEGTMNFKLFVLAKSWQDFKSAILKAISL